MTTKAPPETPAGPNSHPVTSSPIMTPSSSPDAAGNTAYDWDSLVSDTEAVTAGLTAGSYTQGSSRGAEAPTPSAVAAFLIDYQSARRVPLTRPSGRLPRPLPPRCWPTTPDASSACCRTAKSLSLAALDHHGQQDLRLRW